MPTSPQIETGVSEALPNGYSKLTPGPGMVPSDVAAHQRARIYRAMIAIVADYGYSAVKVREVVKLAGVSTRTFYENFSGKEDCFLRTYDLIARRAGRRLIASQADEHDWRERPRLVFAAFARELESDPAAARLALIEARLAGLEALERVRQVKSTFAAMLVESFSRPPDGVRVPPLIVEGMMEGVAHLARLRLAAGKQTEMCSLEKEILTWALCYLGKPATDLEALDRGSVWRNTMLEPLVMPQRMSGVEPWPPAGDRALILSSVAALIATGGYNKLTVSRIRSHAGVSRATFNDHFDGVEDCFEAALEQSTTEMVAQVARAQAAGSTATGGIYRGIAALCEFVASDALLARACFYDDFVPKSSGALSRQRTLKAVNEPFIYAGPAGQGPNRVVAEAITGATEALFQSHIVRNWAQRRQIAASLAYLVLAPVVGAEEATAAIRGEQKS